MRRLLAVLLIAGSAVAQEAAKPPASAHLTAVPQVSAEVTERLEAVEHRVEALQQELAETQERLDFAERLLSKAREERRIGS